MAVEQRSGAVLSRADAVLTQVLVLVLAGVYPAVAIVPRLLDGLRGSPLRWMTDLAAPGPAVTGVGRTGVTVTYGDVAAWTISDPTIGQRAFALLPTALTAVLLVLGCGIAWRLVGDARTGEPFGPRAVRRLRVLAILVVAYGVLVPSATAMATLGITWDLDPTGSVALVLDATQVAVPLAAGMLVLVVAECFRIGVRLRDDVAGLV